MRTILSFVALSTAIVAQSASVAFAGPERTSKSQSTLVCQNATIGRDGIQANWQGSSEWPVTLTPFDFNGNPIAPAGIHFGLNSPSHILNSGGVGQISPTAQGEYTDNRRFEFARRNDKSERLLVDFGQIAFDLGLKKATVTVSRFYLDNSQIRERGKWVARDAGGNVVPAKVSGGDYFYANQPWGGGNRGLLTFVAETNQPFKSLEFIPQEAVGHNNMIAVNSPVENSDFIVREIVIELCNGGTGNCEDKIVTNDNAIFNGQEYSGAGVTPTFVANPVLGGWGIISNNPADNGPFKPEIGWRSINGTGKSERLTVIFSDASSEFIGAKVKLARFYTEFGSIERGQYQLIGADNTYLTAAEGGTDIFLATEPNVAGNPGHFEFTISATRPIKGIVFTALQWVNGGGNPQPTVNNDNSDYHVNRIELLCERPPQICNQCDARIGTEGSEAAWSDPNVVGIEAKDFSGNLVGVNFPSDASWRPNSTGLGVLSPAAPEVADAPKFELGYRAGKSETVMLDLGACTDFKLAKITLARFYIENGLIERGKVTAYGPDKTTMVGSYTFKSTEAIEANGPGYLTFYLETTSKFQYLKFEALPNQRASNDEIVTGGSDNSDYLIRELELKCLIPPPPPSECGPATCRADDEGLWTSTPGLTTTVKDFNGAPILPLSSNFLADGVNWKPMSGGLGALSTGAPETGATAKFEIGYRDFKTESVTLDFAGFESFKEINVQLARFYFERGRNEQALWTAYDRNNNEVGKGRFKGVASLSTAGIFNGTIQTDEPMSKIVFTAGPNLLNDMGMEDASDNSDYLIRCFTFPCATGGGQSIDAQAVVANSITSAELNVYPNPAVDQISISMDSEIDGAVNYVIRDLAGKVVKEATWTVEAGANSTSLPVADLNNGMYILSVRQGEIVKNTKFMIKK